MAASRRELAPLLLRKEVAGDKEYDDTDFSEMESLPSAAAAKTSSTKTPAAFTIIALGTMAIVAAISFKSSGDPLKAHVQATTVLADGTCIWPEGFCRGASLHFSLEDCDDDGIPDPSCFDANGLCRCIGSSKKCQQVPVPCLQDTLMCKRPTGWCAESQQHHLKTEKPDLFIYSTLDCDGDNQPDPFCQKADGNSGDFSCGCLQSSKDCADNFPVECPDMDVAPMQMLSRKAFLVGLKSACSGTLMFMNVTKDDKVTAGVDMFAIVDKSKIRYIKTPIEGVVKDVLPVHSGDHVTAGQLLLIIDAVESKLKPTPAPAPVFRWPSPAPMPAPPSVPNSTKSFQGLPFLTGFKGKAILATGFNGVYIFDGWGVPNLRAWVFVKQNKTVAWLRGLHETVSIKMPEDGVITGLQLLKLGHAVNAGGQLGFYTPAIHGVKLPVGPGFKRLKNPVGGVFEKWRVNLTGKIFHGDDVADFDMADGNLSTVSWDGPHGMVFEQQVLTRETALEAGADLITVGAGIFDGYQVKVGDTVKKGETICVLQVGAEYIPVPAHKEYVIVELPIERVGTGIGFGIPLAVVSVLNSDGTKGPKLNVTAEAAYVVAHMIGNDESVPGWVPFLFLVGVTLAAYFFLLRRKKKPEAREPTPVQTPLELVSESVAPAPPAPAPAFRPVPLQLRPGQARDWIAPAEVPALAPVPEPSEPEDISELVPEGVPLTFCSGTSGISPGYISSIFDFKYQPIGVKFYDEPPVMIEKFLFNSYGKTLGLAEDQILTHIGDFYVPSKFDVGQVEKKLRNAMKDLPYWPLRIVFRTPLMEQKIFDFVERPLGIQFTRQPPIRVESFRAHSLAQKQGVRPGWEILSIGELDTTRAGMAAIGFYSNPDIDKHVNKCLSEGLAHLPYWKVHIDFKTRSGEVQSFDFSEKPLGIFYTKTATQTQRQFEIEKFRKHSVAMEAGVQAGWQIVRIGDFDLKGVRDFKQVAIYFEEYLWHLPARRVGKVLRGTPDDFPADSNLGAT